MRKRLAELEVQMLKRFLLGPRQVESEKEVVQVLIEG